jgi:hypothetical protein
MSKWDDTVFELMKKLVIASAENIGVLMAAMGVWAAGISARNNAAKVLKGLVDLKRLEFINGAYRVHGCKSEWADHSKSLTESLVRIMVAFPDCLVNRELTVSPIATRPDSLVFLRRNGMGYCFGLEQMNNETEESFRTKSSKWARWPDTLPFLSQLFGYKVPSFHLVRSSELDRFLEELK